MIRYRRLQESINPSGLNFRKDKQCKNTKGHPSYQDDYSTNPIYDIQVADTKLDNYYFTFVAAYNLNDDAPNEGAGLTVFFRHKKDNFWYCYEKSLNRLNEFGRVALDIWRKLSRLDSRDLTDNRIIQELERSGFYEIGPRDLWNTYGKTYADVNDYWTYLSISPSRYDS